MARPRKKQEEVEAPAEASVEEAEASADEPTAEEPTAEEKPKKRAPRKKKAEEPVAEEPVAEEPVAEEAVVVEETVSEEPVAEEVVVEEPAVAETVVEPAVEAEPVVEETPAEEPVAEGEPAPEEPPAEESTPEDVGDAERVAVAEDEPGEEAPERVGAVLKPKKKRLPRAQRRRRSKPARVPTGTRKPITRLPKPENVRSNRKERRGVVVSAAMDKTIVVRVDTLKAHPVYKKVVRRSKRLHAHDEQNAAKPGDVVRIVESRPLSKTKTWRLAEVLEEAK